ncbi:MAG TPA: class I SAM-dependent methyltransferase, partial [Actinomycetes bacterium]|nr:class I SAM-dependent methyltransferase [Actinomycetes bacterium]
MAEGIGEELTRRYLDRQVDGRMVALIERELSGAASVLDAGCGSGLYGPALRRQATTVIGLDHNPALCRQAEATGAYDQVICAPVARLTDHLDQVDMVFCSELLEHVPGGELRATLDMLESVATAKVVVTVPNRLFPHAHMDPTHVLRYRLRSQLGELNRSRRFAYTLHPPSHCIQRAAPWSPAPGAGEPQRVEGVGEPEAAVQLAQQRAQAVAQHMGRVHVGVGEEAVGHGDDHL